ncbi:MAG: LacI family DNA-binding transcriptional regulator [Caldilineaceae bacterium]|nr:LacI family DNA-binding transcriptional regulator [Caldilineaceae bacterium]MCB9161331.1 LacI family DNA-binding transcriptional regulator [Caldilineaceae bacterium]
MSKKTTIFDIAKAAGVSVSTVSRILNDKPDVAEATRLRVLQVIEEQNFAPHITWRQLGSGRSQFIALHFPQDFNPPSQEIITSAAQGCEEAGYSLNLLVGAMTDAEFLALFQRGQTDGIILMEILTHDWRVDLLRAQERPFVMVGRCVDSTGLSYVDIDIGAGVADAIDHLVGLGHRHIGFVTLAATVADKEYAYTAWARRGYEEACRRHDLPAYVRPAGLTGASVDAVVTQLLDAEPQITALVTPQNTCVPGILRAVQARGLCIPADISVVGLLEQTFAELTAPPLTAISFPALEMGRQAAASLIAQLEGTATTPRQILVRPQLHVRGSTGPARTGPLAPAPVESALENRD